MSKNQRRLIKEKGYIIDNNVYNINTRKNFDKENEKMLGLKPIKNVTGKGKSGGST